MSEHPTPFVAPYRNYAGKVSTRRLHPISIRFGSTDWHPEPQWLLLAFDLDKQAMREFALKDFNPPVTTTTTVLQLAEAFIAGFEGDEMQEGIDDLLAQLRKAIALSTAPAVKVRPLDWDHDDDMSTADHPWGRYEVFPHGAYMAGRWTTGSEIGRDFPSREAAIEAIEKSHHARALELIA